MSFSPVSTQSSRGFDRPRQLHFQLEKACCSLNLERDIFHTAKTATEIASLPSNARAASSVNRVIWHLLHYFGRLRNEGQISFLLVGGVNIWCLFSHSAHTALCIELCKSLGQFLVCWGLEGWFDTDKFMLLCTQAVTWDPVGLSQDLLQ